MNKEKQWKYDEDISALSALYQCNMLSVNEAKEILK